MSYRGAINMINQMDWQQVVMNGGPPCFALLDDEKGWYCGRAQRWEGHDYEHKFVSLQDLVAATRRTAISRAIEVVSALPIPRLGRLRLNRENKKMPYREPIGEAGKDK